MSIWGKLFNKSKQSTQPSEEAETKILDLPEFYYKALKNVPAAGKEKDPIDYVNKNLITVCPKCGVNYNDNGFEIGYLASISDGIPTVFSSGNKGIYPRCLSGLCPNPNCSSDIAKIIWVGYGIF